MKMSIKKIIDDLTVDKSQLDNFYCSELFLVIVIAIAELPLLLVKKIEKLRFFSFLGVTGIIIFIISVIIYFFIRLGKGFQAGSLRAFPEDWY